MWVRLSSEANGLKRFFFYGARRLRNFRRLRRAERKFSSPAARGSKIFLACGAHIEFFASPTDVRRADKKTWPTPKWYGPYHF